VIRTGTVLPASLDQALHRCIALASRFGAIRLRRPDDANVREFLLDLDDTFGPRLRWTLKKVATGTELSISRSPGIARLTNLARRGSAVDRQLDRRIQLLPHLASLKIAVIGGGTGLYTTLLGLRDRSWNLTAIISGLKRGAQRHEPKDELGLLPHDDASLCLVALAPTLEENVVLRSLLSHRMQSREWRGAHFGTELLRALEEISGLRRAALDAAVQLLGVRGRILVALDQKAEDSVHDGADNALTAISQADLIVIAPGHLELDLIPALCCPGLRDAVNDSHALKVVVTKNMTAEGSDEVALTSHQVRPLAALLGNRVDVVLANAGPFSRRQLHAYAAAESYPIEPDVQVTMQYADRVVTEQLAAAGDLARHDPELLGQCLVEIGAQHLLETSEAVPAGA
jgi:2-phospho-L-lactate transferase/gluconeogenesis factor (CofD/UPF0052 family)